MGIDLMVNFNRPYLATDPRDFWRRWHISLSTWLRDYLYIPLGGSRGGVVATYRALFLTMVLGGLWHGAKWTFVMWGVYHGLLLIIHRAWTERAGSRMPDSLLGTAISRVVMFHLICAGWLLFRADSLGQVAVVLSAMTSAASLGALGIKGLAAILMVSVFLGWVERYEHAPRMWSPAWQATAIALLWIGVVLGPPSSAQAFLYFQF